MPKLKWDLEDERVYETGVDRGVLYIDEEVTEGSSTVTKAIGHAWNGLTAVTESPSGAEANDLYADNMKYATLRSAEQFGFTIEAYMFPAEFAQCDGSTNVLQAGTSTAKTIPGLSIGQQPRKRFGFAYRSDVGSAKDSAIDTENDYKLHLIWGATASPSERAYSSINDSPEAITFSWECSCDPQKSEKYTNLRPTCELVIDTSKLDSDGQDALKDLEEILYGTEGSSGSTGNKPYLPKLDDVLDLFTGSNSNATKVYAKPAVATKESK